MAELTKKERIGLQAELDNGEVKVKEEREDRKAEQLTPERRRELMRQAEEVRRLMADMEQRRDHEKRQQKDDEEAHAKELEKRMEAVLGIKPFISQRIHQETDELAATKGAFYEASIRKLEDKQQAIQAELESVTSHPEVSARSPDAGIKVTSKDLLPDLRAETAAQDKPGDVEDQQVSERMREEFLGRAAENLRTKLHQAEVIFQHIGEVNDEIIGRYRTLQEAVPYNTRWAGNIEEMGEPLSRFAASLGEHGSSLQSFVQAQSGGMLTPAMLEVASRLRDELNELVRPIHSALTEYSETLHRLRSWSQEYSDVVGRHQAEEMWQIANRLEEGFQSLREDVFHVHTILAEGVDDARHDLDTTQTTRENAQ